MLYKKEIVGILVLSASLHLGLVWAYQHQAFTNPKPLQVAGSKAQAVDVTLVAPPKKKQNEPDKEEPTTHTTTPKSPPETTPEPERKPEPKPAHKPEPKPRNAP